MDEDLPIRVTLTATWNNGTRTVMRVNRRWATQAWLNRHAEDDETLDGLWVPSESRMYLLDTAPRRDHWELFFHELDHAWTDWKRSVKLRGQDGV